MKRTLPAVLGILCLAATAPWAQEIPANDGWVTDLAGFLTGPQEQSLETMMESYRQGSGNEIALLTVTSLEGQSLERFALEVARGWKIGSQETNNGALLLVARDDRKIRIEVGRGLEGNLTDSISGRIIRDVIAPEFKRGRFYEGLTSGIVAMQAAAGGDYADLPPPRGRQSKRTGIAGLLPLIFFVWLLITLFRHRGRGGRGGGGGSGILPWILLSSMSGRRGSHSGGFHGGGGFGGFGGGGGFSGGGSSGGW